MFCTSVRCVSRMCEDSAIGLPSSDDAQTVAAATIWVSALDGKPIAQSSHMLLTHLTDVQNNGIEYADPDLTILLKWGWLPHLMRRGAAEIELTIAGRDGPAPQDNATHAWHVWRLSPGGRRVAEVPCAASPSGGSRSPSESKGDGASTGTIAFTARTDYDPASATYLYEIVRE